MHDPNKTAQQEAAEMYPDEKLPLRPWFQHTLLVLDANQREVMQLGTGSVGKSDPFWKTALAGFIVKCVNAAMPRKLNAMFHIECGQLIKTSNGQAVPEDEPVFILRGRDALSAPAIGHYIRLMEQRGDVPSDRALSVINAMEEFLEFSEKHSERMKSPGITHGK